MKKSISRPLLLLFTAVLFLSFAISAHAAGYYVHDPMENPRAAADIIVDPNAVYGYAPNPESSRLGPYAEYDWSDEAFVAEMRQEREEYHESLKELYQIKSDMEAQGASVEEIARAVSTRRNEMRLEFYKNDPEGLEKLKESNLQTFGNENGGTPDYFYEKYGSWETVIEKAFSTNAGADACLGLYDKYYDTYFVNTASVSTPDESMKPSENVDDPAKKSPNTGDKSMICILVIIAMSGAAALCTVMLREQKKQ